MIMHNLGAWDGMDSEKRKKMVLFIGSLLVAVMFLTSYLAFGNNTTQQTTTPTTTVLNVQTTFVSGIVNATVFNYSQHFTLKLAGSNTSSVSLNSMLSNMEANGSIESYNVYNTSLSIYPGRLNVFEVYNAIASRLAYAPAINATAFIILPSTMTLYYGSYAYTVLSGNSSYAIPVSHLVPIGGALRVKVNALVYKKNSSLNVYSMYGQPIITLQ
jgi:hypothetical protein